MSVVSTYLDLEARVPPPYHAVEVTLRAPVPQEDAWAAIAAPPQVRQWLGELSSELSPLRAARLDFGDGDFFTLGPRRVDPPRVLEYGWRFLGLSPESLVTWTVERADDFESIVTVRDEEPERSHDAALALATGWIDFLTRLARFLETGAWSRYACRNEVDASVELPVPIERARDLFTHRTQGTWLPVGRDGLEEGGSFHVETGHALDVRALERPSADRVTFALGLPGWNVETRCSIALSARAGGTLLEIEHAGMGDVPVEESARTRLRAAIVQTWIAALEGARAAVLPQASG